MINVSQDYARPYHLQTARTQQWLPVSPASVIPGAIACWKRQKVHTGKSVYEKGQAVMGFFPDNGLLFGLFTQQWEDIYGVSTQAAKS